MVVIETEGIEMNFNPEYKPNRENLSPTIAAMMDRVFYSRRAQGMNVQWMNEGRLDEWSMETVERAQAFLAQLQRRGIDAVISN